MLLNPADEQSVTGDEVYVFYPGRLQVQPTRESLSTKSWSGPDRVSGQNVHLNHGSDSREKEEQLLAMLITRMAREGDGFFLSPAAEEEGDEDDREENMIQNPRDFLSSSSGKDDFVGEDRKQYPDTLPHLNETVQPGQPNDWSSVPSDMDISTEQPGSKVEAVRGRSEDLFNPGEGYSCKVTGVQGDEDSGADWRRAESGEGMEVAVGVVYLRLVGTRGCTKVSVIDRTQRASFRWVYHHHHHHHRRRSPIRLSSSSSSASSSPSPLP